MIKSIAEKYRLNHNQKKEAEEMIAELMLQDASLTLNVFELFQSDASQISDAFITYLRELRYPEYSQYKKKLSSLLKAIHNNNSCFRVIYNDNFESDEYVIEYLNNNLKDSKGSKNLLQNKQLFLDELSALIKGKL